MHQLHHRLDEDDRLGRAVTSVSEATTGNPLKVGIFLDLNPFWKLAYTAWEVGLSPDAAFAYPLDFLVEEPSRGLWDLDRNFNESQQVTASYFGDHRSIDFAPFLLRLIARESKGPEELEARQALIGAARRAEIPTLVETRGEAALVSRPGGPIWGSGGRGTLGGYLFDSADARRCYGVTCGHVSSTGHVSWPRGVLGHVLHARPPIDLPQGMTCHAHCGHMTEVDVALLDCAQTTPNRATSIARLITNGQIVEMWGGRSGRRHYEIGAAVVEHEIGGACWGRLHLLRPVVRGILPVCAQIALTPPPQPGDSGAWTIRNGTEWAGMVVASDAQAGFALSASEVVQKADAIFNMALAF